MIQSEPKVSIVVTVLNALDLTQKALESVNAVDYPNKEIIVVDNWSAPEVRAYLANAYKQGKIQTLILNKENRGYGTACNQGVDASKNADLLCFFSNDVEGTDNNWLKPLTNLILSKEKVGMVGCKLIYRPDHPDLKKRGKIQHAGCAITIGEYAGTPNHVTNQHLYRYSDPDSAEVNICRVVDMVTAACFLMPKNVFEKVGRFDPIFGAGYCEDLDLNLRVRQAGYNIWYCPQSALYHYEMIATKTTIGGAAYRTQRTINQQTIDKRWLSWIKR